MMTSSSSEKELVEKLSQSGIMLSTPPSSTPELLSLLEKVESELRSTRQDPSVSMKNVLEPIRKVLIGTKLLGHCDEIIKVSVVCCICQIMRISAPLQPYDNPDMKVVFHHIIASLEKLDDVLSECYSKAVRVLEAVARIRMCVMLLDIDYVLAVNVFQLFLKIIRPYHPHAVLTYMEDIMTQLIEESDEVSIDFQVSILESLRKKTLDTAPLSSLLGHHVLEKCAARLKPCLLELMKTMNMNFDDYSDVLGLICREVPEGENKVENALQLPQVPRLDVTPTTINNNNNKAEQLKDNDAPFDSMHKYTKDLHQHMNLSGLSEEIRPDKGHDCFDMNERKTCVEEPTNKKDQEKKSGSSSHNAGSICREVPEGENKVENAGSVPPVGGASALQIPQVPQLDVTPTTMNNNNNNLEPDGSLKTLNRCNQAEQLKDTDAPSDPMHKNTKDLQQQMSLSGSSEKIRPDMGHDCFGMNERKSCVEEPTNKKEQEKKSGSSSDNAGSICREVPEAENKVENAGSIPPEGGTSAFQLPQVPQLDVTPTTKNNNNKAEQLNDTDAPSDPMHANTNDLQQQMNLSGLSENIRLDKGHDCFGMNESKSRVEEPTNKKEHEKKYGSSSDNAGSKVSALPSETGKQSMPDLLAPNSANTVCPISTASGNTHISSGSSRKRGRPKKNQTDVNVRKGSEGTSSRKRGRPKKNEASPSLTVGIKKEEETVSDAEKSSLQRTRKQALNSKKVEQEKKSGSSSDNAGLKDSALPSETGKQSMPDLLVPNSANTVCQSSTASRNTNISSGSSSKRGRPKKNEASPSLAVSIKKEEEIVSGAENLSVQRNDLQDISRRTKHSRKRALSIEKDFKKIRIIKDYGKELVGAKVRVWWPLDRKFYEGVISSFDPKIKKHTVRYTDDEEEKLDLNRECWELLEEDSVKEETITDFPPEVSVAAGKEKRKSYSKKIESGASSSSMSAKKTQGSGRMPGKSIKSEKASTEDNSTTDEGNKPCDNSENNARIKEETEEETTVPSCAFNKEPATDFPPEVSALKKKRKGCSKKKESGASSSDRSRKKARGSGSKPEKCVKSDSSEQQ